MARPIAQRGLGGRVLRGGQLRHPGAAASTLVDVAQVMDLRADSVHDEGGPAMRASECRGR